MTLTLRLDGNLERQLAIAAQKVGVSKSELVRQCLTEYLDSRGDSRTAWKLGKNLFGRHGSGRTDLAASAKRIAREKAHAKTSHR